MSSRIPGFYRLAPADRLARLDQLTPADVAPYRNGGLTLEAANLMVENVISTFSLPNAVGVNFVLNGEDVLVPMVVEEPSVVAAVSNMARIARASGGFRADADPSVMIGQVQIVQVDDVPGTVRALEAGLPQLQALARAVHPRLQGHGGGVRGMEVRTVTYDEPGKPVESMVVLHFFLDCADAMGANMVNTVAERLAPLVEALTGGTVALRILSNLADRRLARASVRIPVQDIGGAEVAEAIARAWRFAWADPYRACTHNKGVMNGIDAVALATGQDWRAIEAGAHAYVSRDGQYRPMTRWEVENDVLLGSLEIPLQVGIVGVPSGSILGVKSNLELLGVNSARELAAVMAAVGLAQNLGALRALATEGIQAGHMRMHARTVAATAGATPDQVPAVTSALCKIGDYSVERARQVLAELYG